MPYVTPADKLRLDHGGLPETEGELTYLYTMTVLEHDDYNPRMIGLRTHTYRYLRGREQFGLFSHVLGALDAAFREYRRRRPEEGEQPLRAWPLRDYADEFYRRTVAPYEDTKIVANGDVYPNQKEDA